MNNYRKLEYIKHVHESVLENVLENVLEKFDVLEKMSSKRPLDARTLLKLPRQVNHRPMCGGTYTYLGIESGITRIMKLFPGSFKNLNIVKFDLNIDGLPVFKATANELWPILCKIMKFEPFVVAVYYGRKPNDVHEYLKDLLDEMARLQTDNFSVKKRL